MFGEGEVRARSRAIGAGALKTKDASASERGDNLKRNEAMLGLVGSLATKPTAEEAQLAGAKEKRKKLVKKLVKKGKKASASEAGDRGLKGKEASAAEACDHGLKRKEASASEGFDILKKKKVMMGLMTVLKSRRAEAGKEAEPADAGKEAQPAEAGKKRMKVVKKRLPQGLIEVMMTRPINHIEIPEEDLVYHSEGALKFFDWRNASADYEQALINQYKVLGYAEDETEVTDDDEEMVEN